MNEDIKKYNNNLVTSEKDIWHNLASIISHNLINAENKIWHAHPVWLLDDNPIVGYSKMRESIRLMFWSGADFEEPNLTPGTGKFKDASITYTAVTQIDEKDLKRWLEKSAKIQWDYKNIIKRKGVLVKIK